MANITVKISDTKIFKELVQILVDVKDDERVPVAVRDELIDKVNNIMESINGSS